MRTSKEAELNVALLQYVAKCAGEGDDRALTHLGLERQDAEAAVSLGFGDLDLLSSVHFPLLRASAIDRNVFQRLVSHVRLERASKSLRDELLARDAPLPLMHHFFGMDSSEYAERGRSLRVVRLIGRPREPTEVEERAIWQAYQDLDKHGEEDLTAEEFLALHRITGIPLRTLWLVFQRTRGV
ncbi:MAG: STY4526/YPO1902 family pathogenicity island replication protein, partial [Pseudonocardiaceae bacterium]